MEELRFQLWNGYKEVIYGTFIIKHWKYSEVEIDCKFSFNIENLLARSYYH